MTRWTAGFAGFVVAALCANANAQATEPKLLDNGLLAARFYAWGSVGTPAEVSQEERLARAVHRDWRPADIAAARPRANIEGQLYLLCVLRRQDQPTFNRAKAALGWKADATVTTFTGDVLRQEPAAAALGQIERHGCSGLDWPAP